MNTITSPDGVEYHGTNNTEQKRFETETRMTMP